ncbi:origin recognition complex subunit 3 N-terminus-domain-containing protein [Boletus edulis]|nr:origin recognition complex subunit 3 N-terminus-domain-containing protein [Boletus edulis]
MALEAALDDEHQTSIYIPFKEPDTDDIESYTLFPDKDLLNGYELRLAAYKRAWSKCLERVQELIHALHAPIVDRVAELVNMAYTDTLPGLPYAELPVISVTVFGTSSSVFHEFSARLESEGQDGLFDDNGTHIVTHLHPQDCSNLTSAMKTLIAGFINKTDEELGIGGLQAPSAHLTSTYFRYGSDSNTTRLVVVLHDFERFEPLVMQDLFEISSLAIPRLPLVFILSLTSPPTPSYIHATYPRSTLARLQVRSCSFSTSQAVLYDILLKTFFDVEFNPDLVLGPAAIEFLVDFFGRHSPSLDGLVSILQLAHMKHFEEPLTVFLSEESLASMDLTDPGSAPFLNSVHVRVQGSTGNPTGWRVADIDVLLEFVRSVRLAFQRQSQLLRVAFRLFLVVQNFTTSLGIKSEKTLPELMCAALRGRLGTSYRYLCRIVRKLKVDQLDALLSEINDFFAGVSAQVQGDEREIISRINTARSVRDRYSDEPQQVKDVAEMIGDWLIEYFERRLVTLEELPLWDISYTGSAPFPSELLNPSLRASIFSGLLHPQDYSMTPTSNGGDDDEETLWDMSDTSILFHRYLESGKMINVFDWFESFSLVLETQRRHARTDASAHEALIRTPSRRKGKQRQVEVPEDGEEELDKWRLEVQSRFIRSLHELDYIGLIKHTGRKADHVMRTVFDVPG